MNPNDTENPNAAPTAEPAHDAAHDAAAAPRPDPIAVLEAEKADLKDKLLRLMADMENLRRRTEREIADARTYAVTNFARDMLNVADNVRRAIESVPEEDRSTAEGAFKGLIEGIDLTERDLLKTLERHGVKKLDPQGQKFDPNLHQAMFEVPNPEVPERHRACRWSSPATSSATACCARPWSASPRAARRRLPTATAPRRRITPRRRRKKLASVPFPPPCGEG